LFSQFEYSKVFPNRYLGQTVYNCFEKAGLPNQDILLLLANFLKKSVVKLAETCIEALEKVVQLIGIFKSFSELIYNCFEKTGLPNQDILLLLANFLKKSVIFLKDL
jgi:hypothetical protein